MNVSRVRLSRSLALASILCLALPSLAVAADLSLPPGVNVSTEPTETDGLAAIQVRVFGGEEELKSALGGAVVSLNRVEQGWAPWSDSKVQPGTYLVSVRAEGWYPLEIKLDLAARTLTKISFSLKRMTGYLHATFDPADALLYLGGKGYNASWLELPTGLYTGTVRRFAYRDREVSFDILEGKITNLIAGLETAPFEVTDLQASRQAFDPRNVGVLGTTTLSFKVSSYGSGSIDIVGPSGSVVLHKDLPSFTDWDQSLAWDGRGRDGDASASVGILPDGEYVVRLSALAAKPAVANGEAPALPQVLETRIRIDSSLALSPAGSSGASGGLLYFADPRPSGGFASAFDLGASLPSSVFAGSAAGAAVDLGYIASFGKGALGLAFMASTSSEVAEGGAGLGAALSWRQTLAGATSGTEGASVALFARAAWAGSLVTTGGGLAGFAPDAFTLELGLPFASSSGTADSNLLAGLAPGLAVGIAAADGTLSLSPRLGAGLALATRSMQVGLSAVATPSSFASVLSANLPWSAAAEFRALLAPSPLVFSATVSATGEGLGAPSFGARLGFGFML